MVVCGSCVFVIIVVKFQNISCNMEMFSLEEEDCNGLFITQQSKDDSSVVLRNENEVGNSNGCEGSVHDEAPHYSDISDEEDFEIPCSQMEFKEQPQNFRYGWLY